MRGPEGSPGERSKSARLAAQIAIEAIASIDIEARVRAVLPRLPPPRARVTVVAIGKGAPRMASATLRTWGARVARAIVVTTDGTDATGLPASVEVLRAAHPIPDARSQHAAEHVLAAVAGGVSDLVLALVSGGASSLVCAPVDGISLEEKRALVATLLAAGAPIAEVNLVRRHLSRIKGGGLARAALPGRTLTLIASDVMLAAGDDATQVSEVIPGAPWDVGSGPASPDPTSIEAARQALARWAPAHAARFSARMITPLSSTDDGARRTRSRIAIDPTELARAAAAVARARGLEVRVLPPSLASVDLLAPENVANASSLPRGHAWVRVAEPSVVLPEVHGHGGRAGRLALLAWRAGLPDDVALACVASDGVDGSAPHGGAVVEGAMPSALHDEADDALRRFDDAPFLARHGAAIDASPSGVNLLDLHVLLRA